MVLPAAQRATAGAAWQAAEQQAGEDVPPFCRWDRTRRWLDRFGDVVRHEFLVAERNGLPCAVVLLTRSERRLGPLAVRRIHLGTAGEPDDSGVFVEYNGLCAAPSERAEFAAALSSHLRRTRGWDELCVDGFDPTHAAPLIAAEPRMVVRHRALPVLDLDGEGDLVDALPARSARATVHRSLRGLQPYSTVWAQDAGGAVALLDDLARLHQRRWEDKGEAGAFASQRFLDFHRDVVAHWVPLERAVVFGLLHRDEVVAALYGFVVGDTLQYYQGGFRIFEHSKIRTGYAAHLLLATAARDRGLKHYEFLVGTAAASRNWRSGRSGQGCAHFRRRLRACSALRRNDAWSADLLIRRPGSCLTCSS